MRGFVFVTVYDRYNSDRRTRVCCHSGYCGLWISKRQYRDASLRVGLISGSFLCADYDTDIYVLDHNGAPCGFLSRR